MKVQAEQRDLFIALNVSLPANPVAAARLAAAVDEWTTPVTRRCRQRDLALLAQRVGVRPRTLRAAIGILPGASRIAEREIAACRQIGASILTRGEERYPAALLDLAEPPPVLYVRGSLETGTAISIVGSRKSDPYGLEVSESFAMELAGRGLTIVSGLALGIDAAAHRGALRGGGRTIAVLGCGIDVDYPRANRRLAQKIPSSGALVTEFPRGSAPEPWCFPFRNRIIAALALGTVVVRGTPKSGSLITAHHALDLGRSVYAVPGNIFDRRSMGPNCLIRDGAFPIQHPREILETLPSAIDLASPGTPSSEDDDDVLEPRLQGILDLLSPGQATPEDEIIQGSPLSPPDTLAALSELEVGGRIRRLPGPSFVPVPQSPVSA